MAKGPSGTESAHGGPKDGDNRKSPQRDTGGVAASFLLSHGCMSRSNKILGRLLLHYVVLVCIFFVYICVFRRLWNLFLSFLIYQSGSPFQSENINNPGNFCHSEKVVSFRNRARNFRNQTLNHRKKLLTL